MAQWVRLCGLAEAPQVGRVMEAEVEGVAVCLANVNGELVRVWIMCVRIGRGRWGRDGWRVRRWCVPWHSWAFNAKTGLAEYPAHERVEVFPLRVEDGDVLVDIE